MKRIGNYRAYYHVECKHCKRFVHYISINSQVKPIKLTNVKYCTLPMKQRYFLDECFDCLDKHEADANRYCE